MRNPNPFTSRQIRFLEAIREKIREINDPDSEIITNESYTFHSEQTKQFGKITKIRFGPNSCQTKAEVIEKAGLIDESKNAKKAEIRKKFGLREARNSKANLFESEWNNIMLKVKKAVFTAGYLNQLFATGQQIVSDPIALFQQIVMEEYVEQIKVNKKQIHHPETIKTVETQVISRIRPYDQELEGLE
ncbi:hypothetical protein ACFL03_15590 [Thermodesulfobacteriota bacterium]